MPNIEKHLRKIERNGRNKFQIQGIDHIYLINLDHRPEKLKTSLEQLKPFGIIPHRFPAIYGWSLSQADFDDIGMKFLPPMDFRFDKQVFFRLASDQKDVRDSLDVSCYGKTCVHQGTSAGSIGGSLSHLSCLQDGFDQGYERILVLEDDFTLRDNPQNLIHYIHQLNTYVGKEKWDVLYTDDDHFFSSFGKHRMYLRPDRPNVEHIYEHTPVGSDFFKIGGRWQLHSVIYQRSGMEKILKYIKEFGLFHTLDVEVNYAPTIQMYNLRCGLIHGRNRTVSDTQVQYF